MASPYDLANLADLKTWLDIAGDDDDLLLSQLITQLSRAILNILDRPVIIPATYSETYDGGNELSIALRQWLINAILSCSINGVVVPQAPPLVEGVSYQFGYVLDDSDVAPPGRMQRLSLRRRRFSRGLQNVAVSYSAGYQITGESAVAPAGPPYTLSPLSPYGDWANDGGVTYADGDPLTRVADNPAVGQYSVSGGVYTFSGANSGAALSLTYGYVPADLAVCCLDWAAERYSYRSRIGQQSKSLGGQETMSFLVKNVPDFVMAALQPYRRVVAP